MCVFGFSDVFIFDFSDVISDVFSDAFSDWDMFVRGEFVSLCALMSSLGLWGVVVSFGACWGRGQILNQFCGHCMVPWDETSFIFISIFQHMCYSFELAFDFLFSVIDLLHFSQSSVALSKSPMKHWFVSMWSSFCCVSLLGAGHGRQAKGQKPWQGQKRHCRP